MATSLNIQKPFATVHGVSTNYPGAKFEQGGYIFDAHRICLNESEVKNEIPSQMDVATDVLKDQLVTKADDAMDALEAAKKKLDAKATASNKAAYAKAQKKYTEEQQALENLCRSPS